MKNLILLSVLVFSVNAFAFESGTYHGEAENQVCDVEIVVKENSILYNKIDCTNKEFNVSISLDAPIEFTYGHHEGDLEDGFHYSAYVSQEKYQLNESEIGGPVVYSEYMDNNADGSIQYKFTVGGKYDIFDLTLKK